MLSPRLRTNNRKANNEGVKKSPLTTVARGFTPPTKAATRFPMFGVGNEFGVGKENNVFAASDFKFPSFSLPSLTSSNKGTKIPSSIVDNKEPACVPIFEGFFSSLPNPLMGIETIVFQGEPTVSDFAVMLRPHKSRLTRHCQVLL